MYVPQKVVTPRKATGRFLENIWEATAKNPRILVENSQKQNTRILEK